MKKIFYPFTLVTLALVCSHVSNAMDNNDPLNLKPLKKRLFSEVEESASSSQTSSTPQSEQPQVKIRKVQQQTPVQTTNTSSSQNLNNVPQQSVINTVSQPQNIQPQQQSNSNLLMSLLIAYLLNQQTNSTTHFNSFQAPIPQQLPPQNFFEPQRFLSSQVLNGLFRQVPPEPQENNLQPNLSLNSQQNAQPTVQSITTPSLPSNFNSLVRKLFSTIEKDDVQQVENLLKKQPTHVVKSLLESKEKNSKATPLHESMNKSKEMITLLLKYNAPTTSTDIWGNTPLQAFIKAFTENNSNDLPLDIIKLFLDKNPSAINGLSGNGDTLLHSVCKDDIPNKIAAIELLISYGALINTPSKNDSGETPFHRFIESCKAETEESLKMITRFLTMVPDLATTKDKMGHTPLLYAARNGLLETTKLLIQKNAKINESDDRGYTPLHKASGNGHLEVVKFLVQKGAKIDVFTRPDINFDAGYTPLHLASTNGKIEVITFLIEHGAQVNERTTKNKTPLHLATNNNLQESALLLIKNGANVNAKDNDGVAPIHVAISNFNLETVTDLIAQGATIDEPTTEGCTPLLKAAKRSITSYSYEKYLSDRMTKIIQTLINHGADIHKTIGEKNNTALHLLVQSDNIDAIKMLAQKKVLNNVQNLKKETPLHIICTLEKELADEDIDNTYLRKTVPQTIQILIDNGASINLQNNKDCTPLQCAVQFNDQKPAVTLMENGATIEFIRNGNRNKPYKRNLPKVLSRFFQTQLKPEKATTDCSLKNPDWLTDENTMAQAFHSKKTITAKENAPVSTQDRTSSKA